MSEATERSAIGERLKEFREYLGFSQEDVAKYLGLPRSAVSLIESGSRKVDIIELKKLARLYQKNLEELTGETAARSQDDSIEMVARAASALSREDRDEVLRFAEFLQSRKATTNK